MTIDAPTSSQRDAIEALHAVGRWVCDLRWSELPAHVRDALLLVLENSIGVALVGGTAYEQVRLVTAPWQAPGPAPVWQPKYAPLFASVERASMLNSLSMVRFEMDEGHKLAGGHPAAHGFPATLALASALPVGGERLLTALVAAYEVAARFGRATTLIEGAHPHGSWGIAGAAAGAAVLLGLKPEQVGAALDTAGGMAINANFETALEGNPVRDLWVAAANQSGLWAAQMAAADAAALTGTARLGLGYPRGRWSAESTTQNLGSEWMLGGGYIKRHASCAFTHPAADAALSLRAVVDLDRIETVEVDTNYLCAPLQRTTGGNRLAVMFSIPYVVAVALSQGRVGPRQMLYAAEGAPQIARLAARVRVRHTEEFDSLLPSRGARVRIHQGGITHEAAVTAPIGDSDNQPLDSSAMRAVLSETLGNGRVQTLAGTVSELENALDAGEALRQLAKDVTKGEA